MTRIKKQRKSVKVIMMETGPKKRESLADPDSYASRKQQAQKKRKKHLSVYEKARLEAEQQAKNEASGRRGSQTFGPLADKIRKLNARKKQQEARASKSADADASADTQEPADTKESSDS
jgi:hypothetical protein